jgi:hypothetical protein
MLSVVLRDLNKGQDASAKPKFSLALI